MDSSLPESLNERLRWITSADHHTSAGHFVMYWMHHALRAHENPALDTALCFARQNGLPLLVYHGLSEQYPYASDRLHTFMLQGHRDVQRQLADRGITSVFHLQRQGRRGPYLRDLARAAAILVTEEMPVQPVCGWIDRLVAMTDTPIVTVDTSCVAPVTLLEKPIECPDEFRDHVAGIQSDRLSRRYVEQIVDAPACDLESIGVEVQIDPISLQDADLASLIGQCKVDHTVAPVADTPGGTLPGYARWNEFKQKKVTDDSKRSDADRSLETGSRLSAYLHYGMVSPFRVAREALETGQTQFLDEVLVWRELAFHFCFHHREIVDTLEAVPEWAKETLHQHAQDPRDQNCSWETLARARSGRPLWDAAQRSLFKHGELNHSVRMTWGKSMLPWLHSPARALQMTLDLNHRFALDGRNPSSYGGVLWCFGQFDKPLNSENPVLGKIRPRCAEQQMKSVDFPRFLQWVDRPIAAKVPRVAVIGAGIAGLVAARTLSDHGIDVTVFEKSRGVGGRTSTRRAKSTDSQSELFFDHGAQYFTARDSRFCRMVNSWIHDGIVQPWLGRIVSIGADGNIVDEKRSTPRYVGVPGMNAVAKHLATDLKIELDSRVQTLHRLGDRVGDPWEIQCEKGNSFAPFDVVLANCPPQQTLSLINGHTDLANQVNQVRMRPCWAMMVAADSLAGIPFDAAFVNESRISWIANNNHKPGRQESPAWVVHASAEWSEAHVDESPETALDQLTKEFEGLVGKSINDPDYHRSHRWLYAIPDSPLEAESLFDKTTGIGACGDWCGGKRVEAAFLSGASIAGEVLRHHTIDRAAATEIENGGICTEPMK